MKEPIRFSSPSGVKKTPRVSALGVDRCCIEQRDACPFSAAQEQHVLVFDIGSDYRSQRH